MRNFSCRKSAFTLIELLVVIAIIAILAAILFPVFAQAKLAAKKTVDLSNMKQMGLGLVMYAGDYDDTTPQASWENTAGAGSIEYNPVNPNATYQIHWTYLLQPYLKSYGMFIAPGDSTPDAPAFPCPNGISDFGKLNSSGQMYCDWQATNSYIPAYNVIPAHDWIPVPYTTFPNAANMIAIADRRYQFGGGNGTAVQLFSGKKGMSGFNPSQPCTAEGAVFQPSFAAMGQSEPVYKVKGATALEYGFWNAAALVYQLPIMTSDSPDINRVWYDFYNGTSNYAFADGHAKAQPLGATVVPVMGQYEYGDTFYPSINPADVSCVSGG